MEAGEELSDALVHFMMYVNESGEKWAGWGGRVGGLKG